MVSIPTNQIFCGPPKVYQYLIDLIFPLTLSIRRQKWPSLVKSGKWNNSYFWIFSWKMYSYEFVGSQKCFLIFKKITLLHLLKKNQKCTLRIQPKSKNVLTYLIHIQKCTLRTQSMSKNVRYVLTMGTFMYIYVLTNRWHLCTPVLKNIFFWELKK